MPSKSSPDFRASYVGSNVFVETVLQGDGLRYLVWNGKADVTKSFKDATVNIIPPADKYGMARHGVVLLPTQAGPQATKAEIVNEICNYLNRYIDCPPFWTKLACYYALTTWIYDRFTALPYLRSLGDWGSGKSRFLFTIAHICYKGVIVSGATTVSPIFRLADLYRGTFAIDEADFKESGMWSEIIKWLNAGYVEGVPLLRSEKEGNSFEPRPFCSYGPKVLVTRERFQDEALESRCITRQIVKNSSSLNGIPRSLPKCFYQETQELRNLLLRWRLDNWNSIVPDESKLLDLEPRHTQIANPLYAVAEGDEDFRAELKAFLGVQSIDAKGEGSHVHIVGALQQFRGQRVKVGDVAKIASQISRDAGYEDVSAKHTGSVLRSFGFDIKLSHGAYQFVVHPQQTDLLIDQYLAP
jgi:hypothetical protein